MKRLSSRLAQRLRNTFQVRRLLRLAEWLDVPISDPNVVQYITDAMVAGEQIQIYYEGSGWRLILPYAWNTSKQGNILLMCYKDTGEIRSYRLDRILQVMLDSTSSAGQDYLSHQPTLETAPEDGVVELRPEESPFADQIQLLTENQDQPSNPDELSVV